jgi:hypothetical protein
MALQLRDETAAQLVLEISGGGALIGIGGAADSVQILAVCGNPIIKSTGVAYDSTVTSASGTTASGSVTTDGSGYATITTSTGEPAVGVGVDSGLQVNNTNDFVLSWSPSTSRKYVYW